MTIASDWRIAALEYSTLPINGHDELIVTAHWEVLATDAAHPDAQGRLYGDVQFTAPPAGHAITPREDVTKTQAIGWVKAHMNAGKTRVQSALDEASAAKAATQTALDAARAASPQDDDAVNTLMATLNDQANTVRALTAQLGNVLDVAGYEAAAAVNLALQIAPPVATFVPAD